ncbi:hypothetical protein ApAK_04820 [Thermoplasmatales archaeon AK]|nr:hypothetical protein [Thermoplasmatales archaeon AK]
MAQIQRKKRLRTLLVLTAVLVLSLGILTVLQKQPEMIRQPSGSYSLDSHLVVEDVLYNNSLYGSNVTLTNPSTIYQNITKSLIAELQISYTNTRGNATVLYYSYATYVISSSPSWSKETYYFQGKTDAGPGYTESLVFPVNVTSNMSIAERINDQLGQPTSTGYSIFITAYTSSPYGTAKSNLTISVGFRTYSLSGPNSIPVSGYYYSSDLIPGNVIVPIPMVAGYGLLASGIALATSSILIIAPPRADFITKFKRSNRDNLIEVSVAPPEDAVRLNSTDDVFRMAAFTERPVFAYGNVIYVNYDGRTYFAEIRK